MIATERLAEVFVEVAATLVDDVDRIEVTQMLTHRSAALFDVDAAGLLLADHQGRLRFTAASEERAEMLGLFQAQVDEGPGQDCFRTGSPVSESAMANAAYRWPRFAPRAVEAGVGAVHAFPMRLRGEVIGALNLFSAAEGEMDTFDRTVIQALADVATVSLLQERAVRGREVLTEQLQGALGGRIAIEQAKGALAQIHDRSPSEVFGMMAAYARDNDRPLAEVALQVATAPGSVAELTTPTSHTPRRRARRPAPQSVTASSATPGTAEIPEPAESPETAESILRISMQSGDSRDVIALTGDLDVATAPNVTSTVHRLLAEGRSNVVLDLDAVAFLDGAAIRALITATDDVARAGGSLWVTHNARCLRLLSITDHMHRLNITDTRTPPRNHGIGER